MVYQKVVKNLLQKFSPQFIEMSSHTSLSDHCNSVPRSATVIHSEPLLNIEWERWAVSDSDSSEEEQ